jgi:hypothetical protein
MAGFALMVKETLISTLVVPGALSVIFPECGPGARPPSVTDTWTIWDAAGRGPPARA